MDTLSDVLRTIRLKGAIYFTVDASPPWVAEAPAAQELAPSIMPDVQHLIEYHVVTKGTCWGGIVGETPVRLSEGDVIVFPHGDPHVMSSAPGMRTAPNMSLFAQPLLSQLPLGVTLGEGSHERVSFVCGFLGCDARPFNPLLETLPRVLHVREDQSERNGWFRRLISFTLSESEDKRMGGECVLARMSELMFIEVVRRHLEMLPAEQTGWLAGLRDSYVGCSLALLHNSPAHAWTLEELAHEVGLSRSAFAERFNHFVGQPPIQYLAQWRMQVAARLLSQGNTSVAEVALEVGYDSEAAFSRAFKKLVGMPPAAWRKRQVRPVAVDGDGVVLSSTAGH